MSLEHGLYKAKQDNNDIPSTNNELLCESIQIFLSEEYISKWSTWNGHEYDNQIVNGVNALYDQCYNKANTKQKIFKNKYDNLMKKIIN